MSEQTRLQRRDVLRGGAAFGITGFGLASGFVCAPRAPAAERALAKVNIINAGGSFSLVSTVMFKELGLFEKYGVDANLANVADGNKVLAGLIGGDGDICGGSGFSGLFPAIENGARIKILCGASNSPLTIIYAHNSHPEIRSVKDLPGHTVGVGAFGALQHQLAVAVLKKYGVDYRTVNFANIGSSAKVFNAVSAGVVDAGVAPIEFRDHAERHNIHALDDGQFYQELPLYVNQAIYASDKAIAEKRQGLIGLMAANAALFRWIADPKNKQDFMKFYRQAMGPSASEEEIVFFQDFLSKPGRFATNLELTKEQVDYIQHLNIELGVQKTLLPFDKVADDSLAVEALKLVDT